MTGGFLALLAMGPAVDRGLQLELAEFLAFALHTRAIWLPPLALPPEAWEPRRQQYESSALMHAALCQVPADAERMLVVTEGDLYIPALTFLFGRAQLGGRVALLSLARLRPEFEGRPADPALLLERTKREALHEVGHLLGLAHCSDPACAMAFSVNVAGIDLKRARFCSRCALATAPRTKDRGAAWRS